MTPIEIAVIIIILIIMAIIGINASDIVPANRKNRKRDSRGRFMK